MKHGGVAVLVLFLFFNLAGLAAPAERLVRSQAEFSAAVKQLQPGDTLVLKDGQWADVDFVFDAKGTNDQPITLRPESPGGAVINGVSRLRIAGEHLVVAGLCFQHAWHPDAVIEFRKDSKTLSENCRLTNCAVVDCNPPDITEDTKYISLYGRRNRVDHCRVEGKTNRGTTVVIWLAAEPTEHRIDHNHFGPRPDLKRNGGETIRVGDSKTSLVNARNVVEHNLFTECNGETEIISNKSCENIYRHNTFHRCAGALTLRHGHRCRVEGNFFLGEQARQTGGVRVIGEDHLVVNNYFSDLEGDGGRSPLSLMNGVPNTPLSGYSQVKRAVVAFNTFVNCKHNLVIGLTGNDAETRLPPSQCIIANNVIVGRRPPLIRQVTPPQEMHWQGNIFFGAKLGVTIAGGISTADPGLLPAGPNELYRPTANSPISTSPLDNAFAITHDIDGHIRTAHTDAGCDQRSSQEAIYHPLKSSDVGISWNLGVRSP